MESREFPRAEFSHCAAGSTLMKRPIDVKLRINNRNLPQCTGESLSRPGLCRLNGKFTLMAFVLADVLPRLCAGLEFISARRLCKRQPLSPPEIGPDKVVYTETIGAGQIRSPARSSNFAPADLVPISVFLCLVVSFSLSRTRGAKTQCR